MRHQATKSTLKYAEQREFHGCGVSQHYDHSSLTENHTLAHRHGLTCRCTAAVLIAMPTDVPTHVRVLAHAYTETGDYIDLYDFGRTVNCVWLAVGVSVNVCVLRVCLTVRQTKVMPFTWTSYYAYIQAGKSDSRQVCVGVGYTGWRCNNVSFFLFKRALKDCWYCTVQVCVTVCLIPTNNLSIVAY